MKTTTTTPRVYVSTYAKYNNGSLQGAWIDLEDSYEEFIQMSLALHNDEEDPELMFQDFEGFPECFYSESGIDRELWNSYLPAVLEHGQEAVDAFFSIYSADDLSNFDDYYRGKYDSPEDYAEQFVRDCYDLKNIPDFLLYAIDWEIVARDMDFHFEDGHVFEG